MNRSGALILLLVAFSTSARADIIPIKFSDFTADDYVAISSDGVTAILSEDPFLSPVSLVGQISVPTDADILKFDFVLDVPDTMNEDYFDFFISDLSSPDFSIGGIGAQVFSGSYERVITSYAGNTVDVIFDLAFGFGDFGLDSSLTIENLQIETTGRDEPPVTVPLLGTMWLLFIGAVAIRIAVRRR